MYHHVLSASGANTALLRAQKPTRARGRHGQTEAWGVGYIWFTPYFVVNFCTTFTDVENPQDFPTLYGTLNKSMPSL